MVIVRRSTQWAFGSTPEPTEVQELVRWLRRQVRRAAIVRSWLLGGFSLLAGLNGIAFWNGIPALPRPPAPGLVVLDSVLGLRFWSVLWLLAAASGVLAAVLGWAAKPIVVGIASMEMFWGLCFLGGWVITGGEVGTGYLTAFIYGMFAYLTAGLLIIPADRRKRVD